MSNHALEEWLVEDAGDIGGGPPTMGGGNLGADPGAGGLVAAALAIRAACARRQ